MTAIKVSPDPTQTATRPRGLSALDKTLIAALAIIVVTDYGSIALAGRVIPPLAVFGTLYLISSILIVIGWRWAFVLPLLAAPIDLIGTTVIGYAAYVYTHPDANYVAWTAFTLNYPLLLLAFILSVVKLAQTLRHETPHAPGWLGLAHGLTIGAIVGAMIIGFITPTGTASGSASTGGAAGTKTVHLGGDTFSPDIVALHTGDTLTLVGDAPVPHTITNGAWDASNHAVPGVEPGAPTVNNAEVNNNTVVIGPFTTPGTYHIFCIVHPGMNLTVIVQ